MSDIYAQNLIDESETPLFNSGVERAVKLLSKRLGDPEWYAADGSEDYDTDLADTLMNILAAKGLYDKETGAFASVAELTRLQQSKEALVGQLIAVKKYAHEMRKSEKLVGPAEYEREPNLRRAWVRARYHDGKAIEQLLRVTALASQSA